MSLQRRLKRFVRSEDGNITIEAVLWMPVFFFLLMLVTDASLAFFGKAQAFRVIENGNRAYSTKLITTAADTATWIERNYDSFSPSADATTTVSNGIVSTVMTIPARELVLFNTLNVLDGWKMTVGAQQYVEWQ